MIDYVKGIYNNHNVIIIKIMTNQRSIKARFYQQALGIFNFNYPYAARF